MATPTRSCLSCRRRAPKPALVRLAVADGTVAVDPLARVQGRGAYLCGRSQCLDAALRRNAAPVHRALRTSPQQVQLDATTVRSAAYAATARNGWAGAHDTLARGEQQ